MTTPPASITDELERLAALQKSGVLTADEFNAQKFRLLGAPAPALPDNKPKSSSKRFFVWVGVVVLGAIVVWFINDEYPETFMSGLPTCDSREARNMVERTVEENSVGLVRGRKIIRWISDASGVSPDTNVVRCSARVALNMGGEVGMAYVFEKKDDQILINVNFE